MRAFKFENQQAFLRWARSAECPADIPRAPAGVYAGQGWADQVATWKGKLAGVGNHHVSNVLIELDGDRARRESMFMVVSPRDDLRDGDRVDVR